ncbi:palmitoyltransferase app isoform X1 [Anopheles coustani]|uniref:palmitoyltransferase app isoform X1 n=1 Tax=Anopheles coustani TaxID=139045 RepID=UPI00265A92DD|nr:palmitoyltransferase app isoform X1 [Anopheles coustani]
MAPSQKVTKKWEIFAGRNKFFCDGYLMTAPNSGVFYFTVILITGTSVLFFVFDCPFLAQRITPAIPAIGGILFIFTLSSLFRTAFSDPGIIPRASQDEAAYIEKQIEVPNSLNSPTYRPPPRTKEVFVKGQTVKLKYCFTCKIFRPPRASHCSLCDNCVDRFDHHCPWVGNCVGKRNYRFFYMFIVSLAFLAVFIFSCTTTHLVMLLKEDNQFIDVVKRTPSSVIIAVICFCSVWSVIGLAGFHTYLTTSDQTTNEDIKGSFSSKGGQQAINPYSQGNICLNCFHILCGPITPSLIDRRGVVTDEYRTQMQAPDKYNSATVPPLVVMQPGMDTLNKHYSLDHELQNGSNGGSGGGSGNGGVYRQRSYDNLQNVPIPTNFKYFAPQSKYNGSSVVSGSASAGTYCFSDQSQQLLLGGGFNSSGVGGSSPSAVLSGGATTLPLLKSQSDFLQQHQHQQQQHPLTPGSSVSQQHLLQQQQSLNVTLPRYPYHRNRAIGGRKSSHDLQFSLHHQQHASLADPGKPSPGAGLMQSVFYGTANYPVVTGGPYCSNGPHNHSLGLAGSSTNSLNNHFNPAAPAGSTGIVIPYNNGLMLKDTSSASSAASSSGGSSSSASTATISSNSTSSATSSLERRCGGGNGLLASASGSGSYLASYDTITTLSDYQQQPQQHSFGFGSGQQHVPHTCPSSPRTIRCSSPSCSSELDPMLHSKAHGGINHGGGNYHHRHHRHQHHGGGGGSGGLNGAGSGGKGYAKFYKKPTYHVKSSHSTPPPPPPPLALPSPLAGSSGGLSGTNPVSPALSFSQFSPSFWSANTCVSSSNRSSMLSTATLGGGGSTTPYVECTPISSSSFPNYATAAGGPSGGDFGGDGGGGSGSGGVGNNGNNGNAGLPTGSPYVQRRGGSDKPQQRFSNVFEYQFNNFDLNSIHEDATNET